MGWDLASNSLKILAQYSDNLVRIAECQKKSNLQTLNLQAGGPREGYGRRGATSSEQLHLHHPSRHDSSLSRTFLYQAFSSNFMIITVTTFASRQEFWNADTGEIICNMTAAYGDEKYGFWNYEERLIWWKRFGSTKKVFNEADYIAILPCIFGYQVTATTVICSIKDTITTVATTITIV